MARAKEIALFGGMWSGEEALAIGLVNRVAPGRPSSTPSSTQWADHAGRRAAAGAVDDQDACCRPRRRPPWSRRVENEARCQSVNFCQRRTPPRRLAAFAQKRKPVYTGR